MATARKTTAKATKPKAAARAKPAATKQKQAGGKVSPRSHKPAKAGSIPAPATISPLEPRQERFVAEYLVDLNATKAAIRAGYSETSARQIAAENMAKPSIQAAIAEARQRSMSRLEITRDRVLAETARIAFFDPRRLFAADGRPLQITELDDDTAAAIAGVEVLEEWQGTGEDRVLVGHVKKYKVADKNSGIDKLSKHLGLYEKDNSQKVDPLVALLERMNKSALPVVKDPGE